MRVGGEDLLIGHTQKKTDGLQGENKRGTIFYRIATSGPGTVSSPTDGGVSATFPDTFFWSNDPSTKVRLNDNIADLKYLFGARIQDPPTYGDALLTGLQFKYNAADVAPNDDYYSANKPLYFYRLDVAPPTGAGQYNIATTSNSGAPSDNYIYDYLIYSTYSANKQLNTPFDWGLDFSQTSNYEFGSVVKVDSGIGMQTEPFILWSEATSLSGGGDTLASRGAWDASDLKRYKTTDIDGVEVIELQEAKYNLAELTHGESLLVPKNNRKPFGDDPEFRASSNLIRYRKIDSRPHRTLAGLPNSSLVIEKANARNYYKPDDYSGIQSMRESTTFSITEGGGDSAAEFATTEREISFARIDSSTGFSRDGRVGLSFSSKWAFDDKKIPQYNNETIVAGVTQRAISRFTSVPLPGPIQLDSDLFTEPTAGGHADIYTYGCRTDITFRVMDMTPLPFYDAANLENSSAGRWGLERGFFIMMSQNQFKRQDSPTGHLYDYHSGLQRDSDSDTAFVMNDGDAVFCWWIVNYQGNIYAVPMNYPASAYPSSGDDNWKLNMCLDQHESWYKSWDQAGDPYSIVSVIGSSASGEPPSNNGTQLPTGEWVTLSIYADPESKYITYEWKSAAGEKSYGGHQFMANGVKTTADTTGVNYNVDNWPAYLHMGVINTHVDVKTTAGATTDFTEQAYTVGSQQGIKLDDTLDSNIVVHVDSVKTSGGMSDATNCSQRYENRYNSSSIMMKNTEVTRSRATLADGFIGTPSSTTGSLAEVQNTINRNTLVIGHETYKALLGNCDDGTTTDDDEKCAFWFNGLRKLNANAGNLTELETDDAGTVSINDGSADQNIPVFKIGYSTSDAYNGKQMNEDQLNDTVNDGALARDTYFITDSTYTVDDFTKNGAVIADWVDGSGTFTKREHIIASAKIVRIISKNEMQVVNPHLLRVNGSPGESPMDFRIYQYNKDPADGSDGSGNYIDCKILDINYTTGYVKVDTNLYVSGAFTTTINQSGFTDSSTSLIVADISKFKLTGGLVQIGSEKILYTSLNPTSKQLKGLSRGVLGTTAASHSNGATVTALGGVNDSVINENELHTWFISPKAYWLTFHFFLLDDSDNKIEDRSYQSIFGFLTDDANPDTVVDSVGMTYNEALYSDTTHRDFSWNLDTNVEDTSVILTKDYGFGNITENSDQNVFGYVNSVPHSVSGNKYADLDALVEMDKLTPGDDVGILVEAEPTGHYEIDIYTTKAANENIRAQLFCQYFDEVPSVPRLSIQPNEQNPFYPEITWECDEDDLWYGLIHVDEVIPKNQYHNAILHLPLDNKADDSRVAHASNLAVVENLAFSNNTDTGTTSKTANTSDAGVVADVEGLAGFCARFDGTNDKIEYNPSSGNTLGQLEREATWVVHTIPDTIDSDSDDYILGSNPCNIILSRSSGVYTIKAQVYQTSSNYIELESSSLLIDGETPYAIHVTFDAHLPHGNVKLFINGKMVDQTGITHELGTVDLTSGANPTWPTTGNSASGEDLYESTDAFALGNSSTGSNYFKGRIEEVVVYNKCLYPVVPNDNKLLFTKALTEISEDGKEGAPKVYTARLFIKDYHNIRGDNSKSVATSAPASFRKAGFRLK